MFCSHSTSFPSQYIPASGCRLGAVGVSGKNQLILWEFGHLQGAGTPHKKSWFHHISGVCGAAVASPAPLERPKEAGLDFRGSCGFSPVPLVGPERPNSGGWAGFQGSHPCESTDNPLSCQARREPHQFPHVTP